ncbi:hypothetical protein SAMN05920897_10912 [Alkalispirochaeta americana]|uniref:FAD-binding domain-containing protein n=1 Tax=Alkalispirochaeta americana TaxID=159291 RepID=A0A1N6SUU5_9SPIO|nr:FAD-dependent oxidoreductase [Alkalispirochaeta americana]SIQ44878.1 hypothetical protein SAMN05920897_10912 [Alkalispirochaeta americana]
MPHEEEENLSSIVRHVDPSLQFIRILKKSLDARKKNKVHWKYRVLVEGPLGIDKKNLHPWSEPSPQVLTRSENTSMLIVGAGPAGLFAALRLAERGASVVVIERGKRVDERMRDISLLRNKGLLNIESNALFGEGGAGTWSDGKLTTRVNKPGISWIFDRLVMCGAPANILYDSKPHLGTDLLVGVLKNLRGTIESLGGVFHFEEKVLDLVIKDGAIRGIRTSKKRELFFEKIIFAIGHSARDSYEMLRKNNVSLEKKGFAIGARIEHPSEFINESQYGIFHKDLPAADYRLVYNDPSGKRSAYSFCMCPGGEVINSSSEFERFCVNGMSNNARDGKFSNSAIVVSVHPEDFSSDPLSGIELQREIEKKAYEISGKGFAPQQRALSFMNDRLDAQKADCSFRPGVCSAKLDDILPGFTVKIIKDAMQHFDKKIRGFLSEGVFLGPETRTSSPVRIVRDEEGESSVKGLYPVGEGAGYSGGIVSSALDGMKTADKIMDRLRHS